MALIVSANNELALRATTGSRRVNLLPDVFGSVEWFISIIQVDSGERYQFFRDERFANRKKWHPLAACAKFSSNPTRQSLADALEEIGESDTLSVAKSLLHLLPWPFAACLSEIGSLDQLANSARAVREGERGDIDGWRAAEVLWQRRGVISSDFAALEGGTLFDERIGLCGVPYFY